jgi:hypothetical protein
VAMARIGSVVGSGLLALTLALASSGIAGAQGAPKPSYNYQKVPVAEFFDAGGRTVVMRRGYLVGGAGFGWDKIAGKHKITNKRLVEMIIKNPGGGVAQGSARVYLGFAQRFRCDATTRCVEVERINLKAVVEFASDPNLGGQKGVITAYCDFGTLAKVDCPSWVNNLKNVGYK